MRHSHTTARGYCSTRSTEGDKLRDALAQTKNFAGVTGVISMDADRNAVKPAVVLKLQDLKFIYQETIQPSDQR